MRNVKFDQDTTSTIYRNAPGTGIAGFLIKKGIVANTTQANALLILVTVVCIGIIIFLQFDQDDSVYNREATQEEIELVGSELEDAYYDSVQ